MIPSQAFATTIAKWDGDDLTQAPAEIVVRTYRDDQVEHQHTAVHVGDGHFVVEGITDETALVHVKNALETNGFAVERHSVHGDGSACHVDSRGNEHGVQGVSALIKLKEPEGPVLGCYVMPLPSFTRIRRGIDIVFGALTTLATVTAKLLKGDVQTLFDNTNAYIAVGTGTTTFSAAHTDLQGATKTRKGMDSTYPQRSGAATTYRATFGTSDGNHAWEEWGVANASTAGDMINRKVETLGVKTSAQSWQFTVVLTLAAA